MSDLPYSIEVLRLAADATGAGRLAPPCLSHTELNPACGDRTTVDLHFDDGRVTAMAHDTKACVLTQASAAILAGALPGLDADGLAALRRQVQAMLEGGAVPAGALAPYGHLAAAARLPARHRCVLLPIDAAVNALSQAGEERR